MRYDSLLVIPRSDMALRTIFVFVFITLCNIVLFSYYTIPRERHRTSFTCAIHDYIDALSHFISANGEKSISSFLPEMCSTPAPSNQNVESFKDAFQDLTYKCSQQRPMLLDMEIKKPILTLFTSFNPLESKAHVHNTTIENWSSFLPMINLILFTNDSKVKAFCEARGWTVLPISHHAAGGVPVLKTMFSKARETFDTQYYGFSNADILFTDKLLETLVVALRDFGENSKMLITGRRFNIPKLTIKEVISYENIRSTVIKRGELFMIASEDYFITTKHFDWSGVPDVVVGRPAYDNWLVAHARCTGNTVIDATDTLMAAHQTTPSGNMDGWKNKFTNYNGDLVKKLNKAIDYSKGFIICPEIKTIFNLCGNIQSIKRVEIPKYCKC